MKGRFGHCTAAFGDWIGLRLTTSLARLSSIIVLDQTSFLRTRNKWSTTNKTVRQLPHQQPNSGIFVRKTYKTKQSTSPKQKSYSTFHVVSSLRTPSRLLWQSSRPTGKKHNHWLPSTYTTPTSKWISHWNPSLRQTSKQHEICLQYISISVYDMLQNSWLCEYLKQGPELLTNLLALSLSI